MPLPPHINAPEALVTKHDQTRQGFVGQAASKTEKASPFVAEASSLREQLNRFPSVEVLATEQIAGALDNALEKMLFAAAGFSDKAIRHCTSEELRPALATLLEDIASHGRDWRGEIVSRFLLTSGDTLGGMMRNVTGGLGDVQLSNAIRVALAQRTIQVQADYSSQERIVSMRWRHRLLLFNKKPKILSNNIDAILLDARSDAVDLLAQPATYLACGEVKGGIDPAGADEHWKTAQAAFQRVRQRFREIDRDPPALFFAGAAIASRMAQEIYDLLNRGELAYAANLNEAQQVSDLAHWLADL
jgi:type II restriction enzyme